MAMTAEERRAKDADRKRKARARAKAERDAQLRTSRTSVDDETPSTMRDSVEESLRHMKWLVDSDAASIAQARSLAHAVDQLTHEGSTTQALSAHRALSRVLSDLGGTPLVRLQRELRSRKHVPDPEGDDERKSREGERAQASGNVTKFRRPPKRRA